jgi:exonuclease III
VRQPYRALPCVARLTHACFAFRLLSAPELRSYTALWSLHASRRGQAGVCVLLRPGLHSVSKPHFTLDLNAPLGTHHPEGRVIALEFDSMRLLFTYSPNSGKTGADEPRLPADSSHASDAQHNTLAQRTPGCAAARSTTSCVAS